MITHPELTIDKIIELFSDPESLPEKVGGSPLSTEEKLAEKEKVLKLVNEGKVLIVCTGCDTSVPIRESTPCTCGGFICNHCKELEEDGVCNHEPPTISMDEENEEDE